MKRSLKYTKQPNRIDFGFLAILARNDAHQFDLHFHFFQSDVAESCWHDRS